MNPKIFRVKKTVNVSNDSEEANFSFGTKFLAAFFLVALNAVLRLSSSSVIEIPLRFIASLIDMVFIQSGTSKI